jgi:uncharacterized protein YdhG (YjbR/CyaY superfamily)
MNDVDAYIAAQPKNVRSKLKELRRTIKSAAPEAQELISYKIPAYKYHGRLVYFAAFKDHISLYPRSSGTAAIKKELSQYAGGVGTIQFPLDKPLPLNLIRKFVKLRVKDNLAKMKR